MPHTTPRHLAVSYPGQCCEGYCIEALGIHKLARQDAEWTHQALLDLLEAAWDAGFMDAAGQDHPAYPRTRRINNPYLRADAPHQPRD